ncbi:MAG TPA: phenylacetate--CoA ligase [Firmicutes bacterium]|nr:phenylacetate--CoA ligase [Bacillota bacterium]
MIWSPEYECMSRERLEELQIKRLQTTLRRVRDRVPFYRDRLHAAGIKPEDIRSLTDLRRIPFTTKEDLRANYPFGLFAVPVDEVMRIHASSGTTGKMTVVGYTKGDISVWAEVMARALASTGVTAKDLIHIAYGYGLFTGGLGVHYGGELLGATVVPVSGGNTKRQLQIMRDFGTTVLACTPSYALYMAEAAKDEGVDIDSLQLRVGILGAEPWSENMRHEIEEKLGIEAYDIYGMSEIIGPGVAIECPEHEGLHVFEDHFLVEVIHPDTGESLPPGSKGELVFTSLTKEAFPIIRYRTRDISILNYGPCACGRTHARMHRVLGRTDDMLVVRGVNVFPSQIESALLDISGTEPHYLIVADRRNNLDELEIWVEVSDELFSDQVKRLEDLGKRIKSSIEGTLGISVRVKLVEPRTIPRSEGKAKRVVDRREVYPEG